MMLKKSFLRTISKYFKKNLWIFIIHFFLDDEEKITDEHLSIFVKRWDPTNYKLLPIEEIVLNQELTVELLKKKVLHSSYEAPPAYLVTSVMNSFI